MDLAIVSETDDLSFHQAQQIAAAIERQMVEHYAPMWQSAGVAVRAFARLSDVPSGWSVVAVLRDADQAGVLGYHALTPDDRPYARVFSGPVLGAGGSVMRGAVSLSVTLSHECLEATEDPYCNAWHDTPDDEEESRELCDRVEGDAYEIDGVSVSNFLGPRAFGPGDGPGPFDYLGKLANPWDMTPGGYKIRRTGGPSGKVHQVFGDEVPAWKRDVLLVSRRHAARTRNGGWYRVPSGVAREPGAMGGTAPDE